MEQKIEQRVTPDALPHGLRHAGASRESPKVVLLQLASYVKPLDSIPGSPEFSRFEFFREPRLAAFVRYNDFPGDRRDAHLFEFCAQRGKDVLDITLTEHCIDYAHEDGLVEFAPTSLLRAVEINEVTEANNLEYHGNVRKMLERIGVWDEKQAVEN